MYQEKFVTDHNGNKIAVQIPLDLYEKLIADSEELEDIKAYHEAKAAKSETVPFSVAFEEIGKMIK